MSRVCIFLADGFEEVEALTVVDLLRRAQIDICMVSVSDSYEVEGSHGIVVRADKLFPEVHYPEVEMLVLPGGMPGTKNLGNHLGLIELLKNFYQKDKKLAAICAAPSVLGDLGLLTGKKATCYPGYEKRLTGAEVVKEEVVVDRNVVTSRGMGTAIPFGLALIWQLLDADTADQIGESIIYKE